MAGVKFDTLMRARLLWDDRPVRPVRRRAISAAIVTALVAVFAGLLVWYRATLHNWPWEGDPARLSICDRDYYPGDQAESTKQIRGDGFDPHQLYPVYRAPPLIGPQVYADASPAKRAAPRDPGEPCTGSLLIQDSPGRYRVYSLSGGP